VCKLILNYNIFTCGIKYHNYRKLVGLNTSCKQWNLQMFDFYTHGNQRKAHHNDLYYTIKIKIIIVCSQEGTK